MRTSWVRSHWAKSSSRFASQTGQSDSTLRLVKGCVLTAGSLAAAIVVSLDFDMNVDKDRGEDKWLLDECEFELFSRLWLFVAGSRAGLAALAGRTAAVPCPDCASLRDGSGFVLPVACG